MKHKHLVWIVYCVLIAGLIAGSFYAGKALAHPRVASAQETAGSNAPDMPNVSHFGCSDISSVAAFENRVHLRCATANGSIIYYAYATDRAHATTANEILAIGNTALALGKAVVLFYNDDPALNPPGCGSGDCRGLVGVDMYQ